MRHYIYVLLLSLLPAIGFAQGENDNWYFGYYAGVNFSSPTTPAALNNSRMDAYEACGTASDANGHLIFYTDGRSIWNRQHQVMQNGTGLTGLPSSQQMAIVKHPGNPNQYFVFTTGYNDPDSNRHIVYSIVDMSLGSLGTNGQPLGAIVPGLKNIAVLDNLGNNFKSEAITIVSSPFGSFWVLIPNAKKLYSYVLNNTGFNNGNPVISTLDFPTTMTRPNHFGIKASPRLSPNMAFSHYLCISSWYMPSFVNKVFSFNNVTGQVTTDYSLEITSTNSYLSEFNKDASVLFLGYYKLYAIDLLSSTPGNVIHTELYDLGFTNVYGSIQKNKYDDIYLSTPNSNYLGKINNPDVYGPGINVDMNNIPLGLNIYGSNAEAKHGLPQLLPVLDTTTLPVCVPDILLTTPETNTLYTYQASNTITTKERYTVFPKQDITMKAGRYVSMLPNTYVMYGARFFATIEDCKRSPEPNLARGSRETMALFLDLTKEEAVRADAVTIYPNPASSRVTIDTKKETLAYWELYDMLGKKVLTGNSIQLKLQGISRNTYLLKIGTGNGATVYKKLVMQ